MTPNYPFPSDFVSKVPTDPSHLKSGLSLANDVVFKILFVRHPHLLADLINAVRHHASPIQVKRIVNPTVLPQDLVSKEIVLDILAEDAQGYRFAVEMQLGRYYHWAQRNVYGVARSLAGQLEPGQNYRYLQPVVGISLLMHHLFPDHPTKADWHFTLRDTHRPHIQLGEALQMHIIELRKADTLGALPVALSAWITCLLHNLDEAIMNKITYPPVREALAHLDVLYADEEVRMLAERRQQALVDAEDREYLARHEGQQQGSSNILSAQLTRKFGPLPATLQKRLKAATAGELETWSLNILDADSLDDVFTD